MMRVSELIAAIERVPRVWFWTQLSGSIGTYVEVARDDAIDSIRTAMEGRDMSAEVVKAFVTSGGRVIVG